jgi:hypothetical protein
VVEEDKSILNCNPSAKLPFSALLYAVLGGNPMSLLMPVGMDILN